MKLNIKTFMTSGIVLLMSIGITQSIDAGTIPKVYLNSNKVFMPHSPMRTEQGIIYIAAKSMEQFGFKVIWEKESRTMMLIDSKNKITQQQGRLNAIINGVEINLGKTFLIKNGVIYIPTRFLTDLLDAEVVFNQEENRVDITYPINISEGYGLDYLGRYIQLNTTPVGDTKNFLDYMPVGISENFFEAPLRYEQDTWLVKLKEGSDYTRPKHMLYDDRHTQDKQLNKVAHTRSYIALIEKYNDLILNIDYRTIDDEWAQKVAAATSVENINLIQPELAKRSKEQQLNFTASERQYIQHLALAREYVEYVKENKLIIEGDVYVEPSTLHYTYGYHVQTWVKYRLNKDADLYDYATNTSVQGDIWHEGYYLTEVGNPYDFSVEKDMRIKWSIPTYLERP